MIKNKPRTYADVVTRGHHAYHFSPKWKTPWLRCVLSLPVWLVAFFFYATRTGRHVRRNWFKLDCKPGWNEWERADFGFYTLKQWADDATDFCLDGSSFIFVWSLALFSLAVHILLRR